MSKLKSQQMSKSKSQQMSSHTQIKRSTFKFETETIASFSGVYTLHITNQLNDKQINKCLCIVHVLCNVSRM